MKNNEETLQVENSILRERIVALEWALETEKRLVAVLEDVIKAAVEVKQ